MEIWSVQQLIEYIKTALSINPILKDIWIESEITNKTISQSGHCYFSLKDENTQINCIMFGGTSNNEFCENGSAVLAHGHISIYQPRGTLQFVVDNLIPQGKGHLQLKYNQIKEKLKSEGLFEESRKRKIHEFPKHIAILSSPTGAVIHDIINIIKRRYPLLEISLIHTNIQGELAKNDICNSIDIANNLKECDVILLTRGGGSLEELWPFNEETVVRKIFSSKKPLITAIGHETDTTLSDLASDLRTATPSVAAEILTPNKNDLIESIETKISSLNNKINTDLSMYDEQITHAITYLQTTRPTIKTSSEKMQMLFNNLVRYNKQKFNLLEDKIMNSEKILASLNPKQILHKGYSIVEKIKTGEIVNKTNLIKKNDKIKITTTNGKYYAITE